MVLFMQVKPNVFQMGDDFVAAKQIASWTRVRETTFFVFDTAGREFKVEFGSPVECEDALIKLTNCVGDL
jgi:hypothetical protein